MKKLIVFTIALIIVVSFVLWPGTSVAQEPTPTGAPHFIIQSGYSWQCNEMLGGVELLEGGYAITLQPGNEHSVYDPDTGLGAVQVYVVLTMQYGTPYSFDLFLDGTEPIYVVDYQEPGSPDVSYDPVFIIPWMGDEYVDGPDVNFSITNQSTSAFTVSSICARGPAMPPTATPTATATPGPTPTGTLQPTATPMPTATTPGTPPEDLYCINYDATFNFPPSNWTTYGSVYFGNGNASMAESSYMFRTFAKNTTLTDFIMYVDAAVVGPQAMTVVLTGGDDLDHTQTFNNTAPQRFVYEFTESGENIPLSIHTYDAAEASRLVIGRVCVEKVVPVATATPTPTPTPQEPTCANPDSGFNIPDAWTLFPNLAEISGGMLRESGGGYAIISATLPAGSYHVETRVKTGLDTHALWIEMGQRNGNSYPGQKYLNLIPGDFRVYAYDTAVYLGEASQMRIYLSNGRQLSALRQSLPYGTAVEVDYFCITQTGSDATATPAPTPLPGEPTLTPTPVDLPPTGCRNADAGLDTATYWSVVGGTIANSYATLDAGGQLFEDLAYDSALDYAVTVRARSLSGAGDLTVYWGGSGQIASIGDEWEEHIYTFPAGAAQQLVSPMTSLLEENWVPDLFVSVLAPPLSPLATPNAPQAQGIMGRGVLYAAELLSVQAATYNSADIEISYVCVRSSSPNVDPYEQIEINHPTCERDYALQEAFSSALLDYHPAILVGLGAEGGMPVHAVHGGIVTRQDFGLLVGLTNYLNCVEVDHTAVFNVDVKSIYCGLTTLSIPGSGIVERGAVLGFTGNTTGDLMYYIVDPDLPPGLVMMQLNIDDEPVDPLAYFNGYPDCRPYQVVLEEMETCAVDDGSGQIPPRNNDAAPTLWEASDWVPWLAGRLYDTVGYPILCALVRMYNEAIDLTEQIANAILNSVISPLMFIYRIGRIFEFLLALWSDFWKQLFALYAAWDAAVVCLRSILVYFVTAIRASASASIVIAPPEEGGWLIFGLNLALKLIGSTLANWLLIPIVVLFCGYATWRLAPWGIRKLRHAFGLGDA